jgi:hypothetical protein
MSDEPECLTETGRITRWVEYVGSSVDSRGRGPRAARHWQAALTKTSSERRQRRHQELCQTGPEANIRILAAFEMDDKLKPYVQLFETIFMA